jgi:hypothetical protein
MPAFADGWTLVNGRLPEGKVAVFKLTNDQKALFDLVRRCHTDNKNDTFPVQAEQAAIHSSQA